MHIRSAHCDIYLVEAAKYGFEDVITLQAVVGPPSSAEISGTDFELQGVSAADIDAAKDFFFRFSGERVLDSTSHGQIWKKPPGAMPESSERSSASHKKSGLHSPITSLL